MKTEAASAGFLTSSWGKHARLQLLTVAELLAGARVDYPRTAGTNVTYKQAPKLRKVAEPIPTVFGEVATPELVPRPARPKKRPKQS